MLVPALALVLTANADEHVALNRLREVGFRVSQCLGVTAFMELATKDRPDVLLADHRVCSGLVIEVCLTVRSIAGIEAIPLIFFNCPADQQSRLAAFEAGADDWLTTNLSVHELAIRTHAVLRRAVFASEERFLRYEDIEMDLQRYKVKRKGDLIRLSAAQFELLRYLMQNPTTVFSRKNLLDAVWPKKIYDKGAVTTSIVRLRRALTARGHSDVIRTVPGAGYALDHEATRKKQRHSS